MSKIPKHIENDPIYKFYKRIKNYILNKFNCRENQKVVLDKKDLRNHDLEDIFQGCKKR
jgi:hypothetical protein